MEIEMSSSSPSSLLDVELRPGKPPLLRVDATDDAPRWAAEHRDALRAAVVEHGSLLVRGLRLRDVAETEAVFRRLGSLMTEKEAFAARRSYSHGVYPHRSGRPTSQCACTTNSATCLSSPASCCSRASLRRPIGARPRWRTRPRCFASCPPRWSRASSEWVGCSSATTTTKSARRLLKH